MSKDVRVLIIDDEAAIRNTLRVTLESQKEQQVYQIAEAATGKDGLKRAIDFHPHFIILDLGLPDMNGMDVLKDLRQWTQIPILILTVSDEESSKVALLDAGADDYLTKPFGSKELLARLRVGLRHHGLIEATPVFKSGDLEVDISQKKVLLKGAAIKLTNTEFELLFHLVREHGKVVPQNQLLKQIWGAAAEDQSHYLRIYINQLRKKIEANSSTPQHILTEPGVGYRIV